MGTHDIEYDLEDLLEVFDEILPLTDEDEKVYWLRSTRPDGISVTLIFSVYERTAGVIVRSNNGVSPSSIDMKHCASIQVLERQRRTVEILCTDNDAVPLRCFLALDGDEIVEVRYG